MLGTDFSNLRQQHLLAANAYIVPWAPHLRARYESPVHPEYRESGLSRIRFKSLPDGSHTEVMVRHADPIAVIWAEAPPALRFLTQDWQFIGPEHTADGVAYHRPGLHVEMGFWGWKNECGFTTTLTRADRDGTQHRASLGALYAAAGVGPASTAPEGAGTLYVIRKRIGQHTAALRALLASFDAGDADTLFAACGRMHPRPSRSCPSVLGHVVVG
jgi:hypothetical protein